MRIGSREVGQNSLPYFIAELAANHNGDMILAKRLIDEAKRAGADCVKFQSWSAESLFAKQVYEKNGFANPGQKTLREVVDEYSISEQELMEMRDYCAKVGIDFASTPFSRREADFLVDVLGAPFIKVASMDLNNYPFLEYVARKCHPIVLSTGLGTLDEICRAVSTIEGAGNRDIVLLHCVSLYPPQDHYVNLRNIDMLRANFPEYPIGFSDHTIGTEIPLAAIARGAVILEKHFTLDKNLPGWDHKVSATPEELSVVVNGARRIHEALGAYTRVLSDEEVKQRGNFRRSIVAARVIEKGKVMEAADFDLKRPGVGIEPQFLPLLVGRVAKRTIDFDELITSDDF